MRKQKIFLSALIVAGLGLLATQADAYNLNIVFTNNSAKAITIPAGTFSNPEYGNVHAPSQSNAGGENQTAFAVIPAGGSADFQSTYTDSAGGGVRSRDPMVELGTQGKFFFDYSYKTMQTGSDSCNVSLWNRSGAQIVESANGSKYLVSGVVSRAGANCFLDITLK